MTKADVQRQANWRKGIIIHASDISHNVAKTCRYYGLSRKTFYKWAKRYQSDGEVGLCDQSKAPRTSPKATSPISSIK
jgi:transposase-like protein